MSFWDGAHWVPDVAPRLSSAPSPTRHAAGAVIEGLLIAAIVGALLLAASPIYQPARFAAGIGVAAAAGRQTYTLTYSGFRVWQEPYAYADFTVTRSKVDNTEVWVKARCIDASGAQAIPGADPYGYVRWDSSNPLVGSATLDSVKNGTACEVWVTRSINSGDAGPGWPETYLDVTW